MPAEFETPDLKRTTSATKLLTHCSTSDGHRHDVLCISLLP